MATIRALGHVVLKARDLDRAATFYRDILGLREVARHGRGHMAIFTVPGSRNHHDLALMAVGPDAPAGHPGAVGLAHVAFKVGDRLDQLRGMRDRLVATIRPLRL